MPLLQRKPKPAPAPASPLEEAIAEIQSAQRQIDEAETHLQPLREAQKRAHLAARRGPKAKATGTGDAPRAAADYFLGRGDRTAIEAVLAESAANDSAEASEQYAAALALTELDRRIKPWESKRDAARVWLQASQYRALRAYAEQLDAERRALLQKQADLLASIYAVGDLMAPVTAPHRAAVVPPSFARARMVEIPPTALQPAGQYATFVDDKRVAEAAQQVVAHLSELGVVEA